MILEIHNDWCSVRECWGAAPTRCVIINRTPVCVQCLLTILKEDLQDLLCDNEMCPVCEKEL